MVIHLVYALTALFAVVSTLWLPIEIALIAESDTIGLHSPWSLLSLRDGAGVAPGCPPMSNDAHEA